MLPFARWKPRDGAAGGPAETSGWKETQHEIEDVGKLWHIKEVGMT